MIFVPPHHELRKMSTTVLDRWAIRLFSIYTRKKDADWTGMAACFTCGNVMHWGDMHCGHFVKRANKCTRFMEANNNVQCITCNIVLEGNMKAYAKALDKKYGEGMAEELKRIGRETCKWVRSDYYDLIAWTERKLYEQEKNW